MTENRIQSELVLSPGEVAYTQDITSGVLKTHTGPSVVNVTGQEFPVVYDEKTGRFARTTLLEAAQQFVKAEQGQYVILSNPSCDGKHPEIKSKTTAALLDTGKKVTLQGPCTFALWPGQTAKVVDGHNLRSNQYLLIRIRDEQAASDNWTKGIVKAAQALAQGDQTADDAKFQGKKTKTVDGKLIEQRVSTLFDSVPNDLAVGKHYTVRGDEFSFYIPPTGVEAVATDEGEYVRNAVTLERLEYCILIDENGNKRYERGPQVVFPRPTEKFYTEVSKNREHVIFQPIELNEIQGLHVKVISAYEENGKKYKEGEELFIKGSETPIYFPRPEHSIVAYDGKHKHFATAVPTGEARYVLQRTTGDIKMTKGPQMLLPDPRSEVIIRRVLSDKQCTLWYPGNLEAQKYNSALRNLERGVSSTRGAVSEGEVIRAKKFRTTPVAFASVQGLGDKSTVHSDTLAIGASEFERSATYTEPRTLTLDTKFSGVPMIDVWNGYAAMVIDKSGNRRVEFGPKTLLLEYDESFETLSMSTGKPKSTDRLLQTVYLRVKNNQISDIVNAETSDHVNVTFKISLRGDFTGDSNKWFETENYTKFVTDHVRSLVKAHVRKQTIEQLYADPSGKLRTFILGEKTDKQDRPGLLFSENGFHVQDVEVLNFTVGDERIAKMLDHTQHSVVESNIALAVSMKKLEIDKAQDKLTRERMQITSETAQLDAVLKDEMSKFNYSLEAGRVTRELELSVQKLQAELTRTENEKLTFNEQNKLINDKHQSELGRKKLAFEIESTFKRTLQDLELAKSKEETEAVVARFNAASGQFAEALIALGSQETLIKVSEAMGIQNYIGGKNLTEALGSIFKGTPIASHAETLLARAMPPTKSNGNPSVKTANG